MGIRKLFCAEYVLTKFSTSGLPSLMLEYRGSCLVLALNPGSIFFVAATTSSIESFCVVVSVCAPVIDQEKHRRSLATRVLPWRTEHEMAAKECTSTKRTCKPSTPSRKSKPTGQDVQRLHLDPTVSELHVGPPDSPHQFSACLRRRLGFVHPARMIGHGIAALVARHLRVPVGIDYSCCSPRLKNSKTFRERG